MKKLLFILLILFPSTVVAEEETLTAGYCSGYKNGLLYKFKLISLADSQKATSQDHAIQKRFNEGYEDGSKAKDAIEDCMESTSSNSKGKEKGKDTSTRIPDITYFDDRGSNYFWTCSVFSKNTNKPECDKISSLVVKQKIGGSTQKIGLIEFMRLTDLYYLNGNPEQKEKYKWLMEGVIKSNPIAIEYVPAPQIGMGTAPLNQNILEGWKTILGNPKFKIDGSQLNINGQ